MSVKRPLVLALQALGLSTQVLAGPPGPGGGHGHGRPDDARELWIGSMLYFVAAGSY